MPDPLLEQDTLPNLSAKAVEQSEQVTASIRQAKHGALQQAIEKTTAEASKTPEEKLETSLEKRQTLETLHSAAGAVGKLLGDAYNTVTGSTNDTEKQKDQQSLLGNFGQCVKSLLFPSADQQTSLGNLFSNAIGSIFGKSFGETIGKFIDSVVREVEQEQERRRELEEKARKVGYERLSTFEKQEISISNLNREEMLEKERESSFYSTSNKNNSFLGLSKQKEPVLNSLPADVGMYDKHGDVDRKQHEITDRRDSALINEKLFGAASQDIRQKLQALMDIGEARQLLDDPSLIQSVRDQILRAISEKSYGKSAGEYGGLRLPNRNNIV